MKLLKLRLWLVAGMAGLILPACGSGDEDAAAPEKTSELEICWTPEAPAVEQTVSFSLGGDVANVRSVLWIFGDGKTASGGVSTPVEHAYAKAGEYVVKAAVTHLSGPMTELSKSLTVNNTEAGMVVSNDFPARMEEVSFSLNHLAGVERVDWDFGDDSDPQSTASASEIVSGSLQDMDRAVLVGQRSYGKGLVQSTRDLPYNGSLKVTISKYYIPSGRCIQQLDYSHRRADGSVAAIPDSLTHVFYTSNGRPVRDGGGVRPEFEVKEPKLPTMLYYLAVDTAFFDFVTHWTQQHKEIPPVDAFSVSDADFEALKAYEAEKGFTYDRQSEKALKNLKEVAEFEGYLEGDTAWFKTLEAKLTPDLNRDFDRFKKEVKKLLETEIVKRYYYQKGELLVGLKDDDVLQKALEVLSDPTLYHKTLTTIKNEK